MAEKQFKLTFDGYWKDKGITKVPDKSGIYCIYAGSLDVLNQKSKLTIRKLLYIGDTDNASLTVNEHEKTGEFRKYLGDRQALCYSFAPLDKEFRERVKTALIFTNNPVGNLNLVKSFEFDKTKIICDGQVSLMKKEIVVEKK